MNDLKGFSDFLDFSGDEDVQEGQEMKNIYVIMKWLSFISQLLDIVKEVEILLIFFFRTNCNKLFSYES